MRPRLLPLASPITTGQLDNASGTLRWWAFRETTGASPANFRLWDGSAAGSQLLMPISLGPGESTRDFVTGHVVPYKTGLFLEVINGSTEGAIMADVFRPDFAGETPVVLIGTVDVEVTG